MTKYSLAHLTVIEASPPELVRIAGAASYDMVGLRLLEVVGGDAWPLATDAQLMRQTKAEMAAYNVGVLDIEVAKLEPDTNVEQFAPVIDAAAELGARHVLTQAHDPEWSRLVDNFGALCDLLAKYGLTADVEFLPWTDMRTVGDVLRLLGAADRANGGVLIDTLHFFRSGCTLEELRGLSPRLFHYIQIADGPTVGPSTAQELIAAARGARLEPGSGGLNLVGLVRELPRDIAISIEVPNAMLAVRMRPENRARRSLAAAKAVLREAALFAN